MQGPSSYFAVAMGPRFPGQHNAPRGHASTPVPPGHLPPRGQHRCPSSQAPDCDLLCGLWLGCPPQMQAWSSEVARTVELLLPSSSLSHTSPQRHSLRCGVQTKRQRLWQGAPKKSLATRLLFTFTCPQESPGGQLRPGAISPDEGTMPPPGPGPEACKASVPLARASPRRVTL